MCIFLLVCKLVVVISVVNEGAAEKVCYFDQEPDHEGKLRWVMPGSHKERCSCAVLLPGGVNAVAPKRPFKSYYTDQPMFTDDVETIHDYFNCHYDKHTDCQALLDAGNTESGVYTIYLPNNQPEVLDVYCDMNGTTGWLVFQRRLGGSVNFTRNWSEYREGFGNLQGEFWLGNEAVRLLTGLDAESNWTIRVDLTDESNKEGSSTKRPFRIISNEYTLQVGSSGFGPIGHGICGQRLGMEDGSIPDSNIRASSFHTVTDRPNDNCMPSNGRLNQRGSKGVVGGWCPARNDRKTPWFQVDLETTKQVEGVIMQGSTDPRGEYHDWVTKYKVKYSDYQQTWHYVRSSSLQEEEVFPGNVDDVEAVTSLFQRPIRARYVRILPTEYKEWPSMRIELIGCKGDVLDLINNRPFSTYDHDNDGDAANCAGLLEGGWWFDRCSGAPQGGYHGRIVESNLNGEYSHRVNYSGQEYRGIRWSTWEGKQIVKSEMKIRRDR